MIINQVNNNSGSQTNFGLVTATTETVLKGIKFYDNKGNLLTGNLLVNQGGNLFTIQEVSALGTGMNINLKAINKQIVPKNLNTSIIVPQDKLSNYIFPFCFKIIASVENGSGNYIKLYLSVGGVLLEIVNVGAYQTVLFPVVYLYSQDIKSLELMVKNDAITGPFGYKTKIQDYKLTNEIQNNSRVIELKIKYTI